MMKKRLLMFLSAVIISTSLFAWNPIFFTTRIDDDTKPIGNGHPKSPNQPPVVYYEDDVLLFESDHLDYVLHIKDMDGEVVYTTTVYSMMTLATLPSTLSGEYELSLVPLSSTYYYIGYIEL